MRFRILHIAPLVEALTETAPGGSEQCVNNLAKFQSEKGHSVSVIAPVGSRFPGSIRLIDLKIPPGKLVPIETSRSAEDPFYTKSEIDRRLLIERKLFQPVLDFISNQGRDFDLIHNHAFDFTPLFSLPPKTVHTLHLPPILPWVNNQFRRLFQSGADLSRYVTVSRYCAEQYKTETEYKPDVIHNGIDVRSVEWSDQKGGTFLWVGRVSPEKGLHRAIDLVAGQLQNELIAIGRVYDPRYFETQIHPRLVNPLVRYLGPLPHAEVLKKMREARALVFPLERPEAFGLTVVEALASGTPVVAFALGAIPEIIENGRNGYVVDTEKGFLQAIQNVDLLDRRKCRASAVQRFSIEDMVWDYEKMYARTNKVYEPKAEVRL